MAGNLYVVNDEESRYVLANSYDDAVAAWRKATGSPDDAMPESIAYLADEADVILSGLFKSI